jgi:ABC-type Na+ efflux pump permease subunit
MWKLVRANLTMFLRDRSTLFWSLAFPVIFVVVFGLFNFEQAVNVHIDVVAAHPSAVSAGLVSALQHTPGLTVKQVSNLAAARKELSDGKIDVVLVVPETDIMAPGTASAPLVTYYNQTSVQAGPYGLAVVRRPVPRAAHPQAHLGHATGSGHLPGRPGAVPPGGGPDADRADPGGGGLRLRGPLTSR